MQICTILKIFRFQRTAEVQEIIGLLGTARARRFDDLLISRLMDFILI